MDKPAAARRPAPSPQSALHFLQTPAAHRPHAGSVDRVETIETHMSWVFLAGTQVLKLKKAVRFPFLDFSTLRAREACCREEVRLNLRLAPGVYHGVMALRWHAGRFSLEPDGPAPAGARTVEWLVWMRRLPAQRMLDQLLASHAVQADDIAALVAVLGAFYRHAERVDITPADHLQRFHDELAQHRAVLLHPGFTLAGVGLLLERLEHALHRCRSDLLQRAAAGCIVDGHGDLRPAHVCLLRPPLVIDGIEFNAGLRQVDPFDELCQLGLDCAFGGAPWIHAQLLAGCADLPGGMPPPALLQLYTANRALLRARLAMAHLLDAQPRTPERWQPLAARYLDHGARALEAAEACVDAAP